MVNDENKMSRLFSQLTIGTIHVYNAKNRTNHLRKGSSAEAARKGI